MRQLRPPTLDALFLVLVLANLAPVIWFSHLPSADGPAHVFNASVLSTLISGAGTPAWRFVELNTSVPPNIFAHVLQAVLGWAAGPEPGERVFIAAYVMLLPMALRYLLRAVSDETGGIEFLGLPLVFNQHFHWGFYNFLAGLVAYLFAVGYWLRVKDRPANTLLTAKVAAVSTVVYLCHPVPLMAFWITVGSLWAANVMGTRTRNLKELRVMVLAALPAGCLYLHYMLTRPGGPDIALEWSTPRYAASVLLKLYPLGTYTSSERGAAIALSCLVIFLMGRVWLTRAFTRPFQALLPVAAVLAFLVFVTPSQLAGGTMVTPRLVYFPLFVILMWLASASWSPRWVAGLVLAGLGLATAGHAARWPVYQRYDLRMSSFLDLSRMRAARPVELFQTVNHRATVGLDGDETPPLSSSAWGYVAANHNGLTLDYEPALGYFPLRYRRGANPATYALPVRDGCVLSGGGLIDETRYRKETGLKIDTQIVWVDAHDAQGEACVRAYGKTVSAERRNAHGVLLWFDSND